MDIPYRYLYLDIHGICMFLPYYTMYLTWIYSGFSLDLTGTYTTFTQAQHLIKLHKTPTTNEPIATLPDLGFTRITFDLDVPIPIFRHPIIHHCAGI